MRGNVSSRQPGSRKPIWKRILSIVVRYVLPWGITIGLLLWFFKTVNFHEVMAIVRRGCNFGWIAAMMALTALALVVRGLRWNMQLMQVGAPRMPMLVSSCAIFGAYALNLVFPRLGEAWRCLYVSRRQHCPFMKVVGTDIGDRTADLLCVIVTIILALALAPTEMNKFFARYDVGRIIRDVFSSYWTWIGIVWIVGGVWVLFRYFERWDWVRKFHAELSNVWQGFIALFKVRPVGNYLWLTLGIWVCYFLQTWVCFFAFSFTRPLVETPGFAWGMLPGLVALVFGSCSTLIPSNGGLGPWTIATAYALQLFGIAATDAAAFALVVWGMQAVTLIALGVFTAFYARFDAHNAVKKAPQ